MKRVSIGYVQLRAAAKFACELVKGRLEITFAEENSGQF